jgi:hypothetical protein
VELADHVTPTYIRRLVAFSSIIIARTVVSSSINFEQPCADFSAEDVQHIEWTEFI